MKISDLLLHRSPYENYWLVVKAMRRRWTKERLFTKADVFSTRKYGNPLTEIDRFARYIRVLTRVHNGFVQPDFRDAVVLELGCGPLLGIGPFAVYCGARRVFYSEPAFNRDLIRVETIREGYFRSLHEELLAEREPGRPEFVRFEDFYDGLLDRCSDFVCSKPQDRIDFLYSNSVLEHVALSDLPMLLARLRCQSSLGCRYIHVVDFSDHRDTHRPFARIYRSAPSVNRSQHEINALRPSEMKAAIEKAGFPCKMSVYRNYRGDLPPLDEYWHQFPEEELRTQVAFFVNL